MLSQCSGGYRSYFINVIIPLTRSLNEKKIWTQVLIPQSSLVEYKRFLKLGHYIAVSKNKRGFSRILYERNLISSLIKEHTFTKVFTPYQIGPTFRNVVSILMFRNMEPYIASRYTYPIKNKLRSFLLRKLGKQNLQNADHVIAVSKFTSEFLLENTKVQSKKIHVIPHGIKSEEKLSSQETDIFLSVGSMMPYRRYEDVIAAFEKFKTHNQNRVQLVLVGGGSDDQYAQKINNLIENSQFKNDILIKGKLSHQEVINLYTQCKIFIMSSEIEACPNTALEAMAYSCCIISSENKPMPEFFGNAAMYYPRRDVNHLYKCIDTCYNDPRKRQKMKNSAFKRSEIFTWTQTLEKTYNLLKNT